VDDDGLGVDLSTLDVAVNGTAIVTGGVDQTGGQVTITSHSPTYTVIYDPAADFADESTVTVNVQSEDLAAPVNSLDETYDFTIGTSPVTITQSDTVGQGGDTVTDDSTDIEITIPPGALDETTDITIGIIEDPPALPDSVDGIGLAYHFGPEGIQFNDSVTIRIPYTQADLDSAGVTDPMDLPIYYYSTTNGEWVKLDVFATDASYVYVKVKEFCYLVYGKITTTPTGIIDDGAETRQPNAFDLMQNIPNPFNPGTSIRYQIPESGQVTLQIYNALGQQIRSLVNSYLNAGNYSVKWDGLDDQGMTTGTGIYIYVLKAGESITSKKMLKLE